MRISALSLLRRGASRGPSTIAISHVRYQLRFCGSYAGSPSTTTTKSSRSPPPTSSVPAWKDKLPTDHRAVATAQELLITHPSSPGSPLFLPHGAHIFNKLQSFLRAQYALYGYKEVITPTIYKRSLWETSGHWENYKEDMFEVTGRGASGVKDEGMDAEENQEYGLKPMNCPGHCLLFKHASKTISLRDLPVRYADFAPLHRNELSGALSGLTRVRRFHQDDAHIFCRPSQIAQEISSTLQFISTVYKVFHLPSPMLVLSTRPPNYIGTIQEWDLAESALKSSLALSGQSWTLNEGDGAFYGPKIDILITDSDGKQHQTATIQLDFQLPRRFELGYMAPAPAAEQRGVASTDPQELEINGLVTPVIIHRAILGSFERFMALLMEYYDGRWPFWLSPRQAIVIPVAVTDEILAYARNARDIIAGVVQDEGRPLPISKPTFNVDIDESSNSLGKKIRAAKTKRYNHIIVVGEKNVGAGTVSVDSAPVERSFRDQKLDSEGRGGGGDGEWAKKEMTADDVYKHFRALEDSAISSHDLGDFLVRDVWYA